MAEHEHRSAKNAAVVHNASKQRFEIKLSYYEAKLFTYGIAEFPITSE